MSWNCHGCGARNSNQFIWCTTCDHAKRACSCGGYFNWQEGGFSTIECSQCDKVIEV